MKYIFLILLLVQVAFASVCTPNTLKRLSKLKLKKSLSINFSNLLKDDEYTLSPLNFFGIHNHFQGIAFKKNKLFITGGNKSTKSADLFIHDLSRKTLNQIKLNKTNKHWHAGSFQLDGNFLFIPIEKLSDPLSSEILEFNTKDNTLRYLFSKKTNKTGALDFLNINDKKIIVLFDPEEISFYEYPDFKLLKSSNQSFFTGSGAKIIQDCDGSIYFINMTNDGVFPPLINNRNILNIYILKQNSLSLVKVKDIELTCNNCNFRGAVNLQVLDNKLNIISSDMYLNWSTKTLNVDFLTE